MRALTQEQKRDRAIKAARVIEAVSAHTSVGAADMRCETRLQHVVDARAMAMALMREVYALPLQTIGRIFQRDHSSVCYCLAKVKRCRQTMIGYAAAMDQLAKRIMLGTQQI